jgi:hypothetical protein
MAATQDNPNLDWQRLVSTAVLGTERAGAAPLQADPELKAC